MAWMRRGEAKVKRLRMLDKRSLAGAPEAKPMVVKPLSMHNKHAYTISEMQGRSCAKRNVPVTLAKVWSNDK
jgi:hypothetical protein